MHSSDPGAASYIREGCLRDLDATPDTSGDVIKKLKKRNWAYELTGATAGPPDPSEEHTVPYLVTAMAPLHKPGVAPGDAAIKALRNAVDAANRQDGSGATSTPA